MKLLNEKNKIIILSSLIGILTITLIVGITTSGKRNMKSSNSQLLITEFDVLNTVDIECFHDGKTVKLTSDNSTDWEIAYGDDFRPADNHEVSKFLTTLDVANILTVASSKADRLEEFQIDDESSRVSLTDKRGNILVLKLGSFADMGQSMFVNIEGSPKVYKISETALSDFVKRNNNGWADLRMFADLTSAANINKIETSGSNPVNKNAVYSEGDFSYLAFKENSEDGDIWKIDNLKEGYVASANALDDLAKSIKALRAYDYYDGAIDRPLFKIVIETVTGLKYELEIGKVIEDSSHYPVKLSTSDYLYKLSKTDVEKIVLPLRKLSQEFKEQVPQE